MAGVYKRKGSPFWWIWWRSNGARKLESSGKRVDDPLGWKQAFDLARMREGEGALPVVGTKRAAFDVWVETWLATLFPDEHQHRSLRVCLMHWRFIRGYLGSVAVTAPSGVTYALAQDYYAWRQKNKRFPGRPKIQTAAIEVALLRRVMREAVKRGFVPSNPLADLEVNKPKPKEKPEITAEEEAGIRAALVTREGHLPITERWMTISFLFGIRHGWRIAETSFPLARVNFEKWTVLVHSKGDKWRTVPIHPELRPILAELKQAGATFSCVFPENSSQRASQAWSMLLRGCERDNIKGLYPHLCHHCCRVSVVSRLARAGVPERLVMEFVGHWSITSHRIYSRVAHGDLERCISQADPASDSSPNPSPQIGATS